MPQLTKGGKFVFGWCIIREDLTVTLPEQTIQEYGIEKVNRLFLISGSKTTGGFSVSHKELLLNSVFENITGLYPDLCINNPTMNKIIDHNGRKYVWVYIETGVVQLTRDILSAYNLKTGDKLMCIRSSNIAFMMGAKGPLLEAAKEYKGVIGEF
ncbi:MAG: hypothetical protein E6767_02765 [Dysgonomonas sp.]|nr:hypothetical protein [Dysgonomonas sp.]